MIKKYSSPILWMAFIFILSSFPGTAFPKSILQRFAWLAHLVEYSILGLLWYRALKDKFLVIIIICILFAISDELHQLFVPFRECSILDIIVDIAGICIGIIIGKKLKN